MKPLLLVLLFGSACFAGGSEIKWNVDTTTAFDLTFSGMAGFHDEDYTGWAFGGIGSISDSGLWDLAVVDRFTYVPSRTLTPFIAEGPIQMKFLPYTNSLNHTPDTFKDTIIGLAYRNTHYTIGTGDIVTGNTGFNEFGGTGPGNPGWSIHSILTLHRPTEDPSTWTWDAHIEGTGPDMTPHVPEASATSMLLCFGLVAMGSMRCVQRKQG